MSTNQIQRLVGLGLLVLTVICIALTKDATIAILTVPMSLYLILTEEDMIVWALEDNSEDDDDDEESEDE